jgi:ATP-binding cassette, subfamily B, multidrug efflux pump
METLPEVTSVHQRNIFFRLMRYTKPHKKKIFTAFLLLLLTTAGDVLGPIIIKIFIDDYLTPREFPYGPLVSLGSAYLIIQIGNVLISYFQLKVSRNCFEDHSTASFRCFYKSPKPGYEVF